MRRPFIFKLLAVLIAILMVLPMTLGFCTHVDAEEAPPIRVHSWGLMLSDGIILRFILDVPDELIPLTTLQFFWDGGSSEVELSADDRVDDGVEVRVNFAAAMMTVPVEIQATVDGQIFDLGSYSIQRYAKVIIDGVYPDATRNLTLAMLHYGTEAQKYFEMRVDDLANAGYENTYVAPPIPEGIEEIDVSGHISGLQAYGFSAVLKSKLCLRFFLTGDMEGCVVTHNGQDYVEWTIHETNGLPYIQLPGISPLEFGEQQEVVVTKGDQTLTIRYGVLNYIQRLLTKGTSTSPNLLYTMYNYYLAAVDYEANPCEHISTVFRESDLGTGGLSYSGEHLDGVYASAIANNAPVGTTFVATENSSIEIYRDEEVVGHSTPRETVITKISDTEYKISGNISGTALQDLDIIKISGRFLASDQKSEIDVAPIYILIDETAQQAVYSTTPPEPWRITTLTNVVAGNYSTTSGTIKLQCDENDIPVGETIYSLHDAELSLTRRREEFAGIVDGMTLVKTSPSEYTLSGVQFVEGVLPVVDQDYIKIYGSFQSPSTKIRLEVPETYLWYHNGNYIASSTVPEVKLHEYADAIYSHDRGWATDGKIYFQLDDNLLPVDASVYVAQDSRAVSLVRNGVKTSVGDVSHTGITKVADGYYLDTTNYGRSKPQINDVYIFEGTFKDAISENSLTMSSCYLWIQAGGKVVCSTTMPNVPIAGGYVSNAVRTESGLQISLATNTVPVGTTLSGTANNIGSYSDSTETYLTTFTMTKDSETTYTINCSSLPAEADITAYIVGGDFTFGDSTLHISKTYLEPTSDGYKCTDTPPAEQIELSGSMSASPDGGFEGGFLYFSLAENNIPVDNTGLVVYAGEVEISYAGETMTAYAEINKYGDTQYYMMLPDFYELNEGDYIIVSGQFICEDGSAITIDTTYIVYSGGQLTFSTDASVLPAKPSRVLSLPMIAPVESTEPEYQNAA